MPNASPDHAKIISVIKPLMLAAARIAMKHYGNLQGVQYKQDDSPLTAADLEVDQLITDTLAREFPDLVLISEERARSHKKLPADATYFLIDPIDGTKEFINKRDEFTVNIALIEKGKPVLGAVCVPAKSILYIGSRDDGGYQYQCDLEGNTLGTPTRLQPVNADNQALNVVASRSHLCS